MKRFQNFFQSELNKFKNPYTIVLMAMFIAMTVVSTRFFKFETPFLRLSLDFIPIIACSAILGPIFGGISAALSDIVGVLLFNTSGAAPHPGFTFTSLVRGVIYGLFLYKIYIGNKSSVFQYISLIVRSILAASAVTLVADLLLNTIWLSQLYNKAWFALLITRITAKVILIIPTVIFIVLFIIFWSNIKPLIPGIRRLYTEE